MKRVLRSFLFFPFGFSSTKQQRVKISAQLFFSFPSSRVGKGRSHVQSVFKIREARNETQFSFPVFCSLIFFYYFHCLLVSFSTLISHTSPPFTIFHFLYFCSLPSLVSLIFLLLSYYTLPFTSKFSHCLIFLIFSLLHLLLQLFYFIICLPFLL